MDYTLFQAAWHAPESYRLPQEWFYGGVTTNFASESGLLDRPRGIAQIGADRFQVIAEAGHFPHIEKLDEVLESIGAFAAVEQ